MTERPPIPPPMDPPAEGAAAVEPEVVAAAPAEPVEPVSAPIAADTSPASDTVTSSGRPELIVGAAFVSGLALAFILRRLANH
ncbi:MAG: hypothetical protein WCK06_06530 [Actinomycetota bacterium]